jgi:hypothetical protein
MDQVIRIVLAAMSAFFVIMGLRLMAMPEAAAATFFIEAQGAAGASTIRGDLGGTFLGAGLIVAVGLIPRTEHWLYSAAILMGAIALGRVISLVFDGYAQSAVAALIVEIVFVIILVIGALRLRVRHGPS